MQVLIETPSHGAEAAQAYDRLTVILPTLNEERNLPPLLERLGSLYPGARVIVADDDSTDGTRAAAQRYKGPLRVRVLHREGSQKGLTASVVDAVRNVETPVFVVMDADLQHPPEAVHAIFAAASNGSHIAVGRRTGYEYLSPPRRAISRTARALTRTYLRTRRRPLVDDPMSGFFGAKTEFARQLLDRHEASFEKSGFKVLVDFLRFAPHDTCVEEVPYRFAPRHGGESKLRVRHTVSLLRQLGPLGRAAGAVLDSAIRPAFWRFALVGLSGVLVNQLLLQAGYAGAGLPLMAAGALAIAGAITWNFTWNDRWTFGDRRRVGAWPARLARFAGHCGLGALLNLAILYALVHAAGVHHLLANGVGIAASMAWNWFLAHLWTWPQDAHAAAGRAAPADATPADAAAHAPGEPATR